MPAVSSAELAAIIRDHIEVDRYSSDQAIALDAADRLGMDISPSRVARLRRTLGISRRALQAIDDHRWNVGYFLEEFADPNKERVNLAVPDVAATIAFYQRLGARALLQPSGEGSIRLGSYRIGVVPGGTADSHQAFIVEIRDLELYRRHLRSEGVTFVERNASVHTDRELVVSDPDERSIIVRLQRSYASPRMR